METVKIDLGTAAAVQKLVKLGLITYYEVYTIAAKYSISADDTVAAGNFVSHVADAIKAKKQHLTMKMTTAFSTAKLCKVGCVVADVEAQQIIRGITQEDIEKGYSFNEAVELQLQS